MTQYVDESPRSLMGYRVGIISPHSEVERRTKLDEIFCSRSLPFSDDCSSAYRSGWGAPKSAKRLFRMALQIQREVYGPSVLNPDTREDCINDLAWLKKTYFRKTVHGFKWPATGDP